MHKKHKEPEYKLPDGVIEAVNNGQAVLFIGAGVSKQYGVPLWDELGNRMLLDCNRKGKINYKEYENIRNRNYSPLQKVTIAAKILDYSSKDICDYLDIKINEKNREMLATIADCLGTFRCKIYTTNADMILENESKIGASHKYYTEILKEYIDVDELSIIHVHGATCKPESIVFTIGDYFAKYKANSDLEKAINYLFKGNRFIIFIGYGLNDFELLRQVLDTSKNRAGKIYMLNEYYKDEKARLSAEKKYYGDFGITVIPYYIDEKGYDAFVDVLKFWKRQIIENRLALSDKETELKLILDNLPDDVNIIRFKKLEKEIKKDRFFKLIEKSHYVSKWIALVDNSNKTVKPNFKPATEKDGFIKCKPWPWLNCLYIASKSGHDVDDTLVVKVLNSSLKLLKKDVLYLKNYEVFNTLFKLLFSKKKYIEEADFLTYIELAFSINAVDRHSSVVTFKRGFKNLDIVESNVFFKLFNLSVDVFKEMYMLDFFYSNEVLEYVYRYPSEFIDYSISCLEELDIYDVDSLGALVKLEKESVEINKNKLIIVWLKEAAKQTDYFKVVKKIQMLLNSKTAIDCKAAVYLSTVIRYEELLDYNPGILSLDCIYLDLAEYIEMIDFSLERRDSIAKKIYEANFVEDEKKNIMLQNNLLKRIPYSTIDINLDEIDKEKERILVNSYGKGLYSYSDGIDYADYIYRQIKDLEYNRLPEIKKKLRDRITFFTSHWANALSRYFVCGNLDHFINNLSEYRNDEFLLQMNENIEKYSQSFDYTRKYINCIVDESILNNINVMRSFIYLCKDTYKKYPGNKEYFIDIMNKLNLKFIIEQEKSKKWDFSKLINSVLFLYYEFLIGLESNEVLEKLKIFPSEINDYIVAYNFKFLSESYEKKEIYSNLGKFDARLFYISFAYGNPDKDSFMYMTGKNEFVDYLNKIKKGSQDKKYYYYNYTVYMLDESGSQTVYDSMIKTDPFYLLKSLINILLDGHKIYNNKKTVRLINDIIKNIFDYMYRKQMKDQYLINDILKCIYLYNDEIPILWNFATKSAPYFKGYDLDELVKITERYYDKHNKEIFEILKDMIESSNSLAFEDDIDNILANSFYPYFNESQNMEIKSLVVEKRK